MQSNRSGFMANARSQSPRGCSVLMSSQIGSVASSVVCITSTYPFPRRSPDRALVWLLGIYLLIAGIFRIVGIFLDASNWGWKLAGGILSLIAGLAILSNPLWSTTVASTWLVILV